MSAFSIQEIKAQVRLEDIVQERGVSLHPTQGGERLEGKCPFHVHDSTPSFNIYLQSQKYYCFGCGANGDVIDFVQTFDLCSCQEALARLSANIAPLMAHTLQSQAPRRTLPVPFPDPTVTEAAPYQALLTALQQQYHQTLLDNHALCETLQQERGITYAGITACHLGYVDSYQSDFGDAREWNQEEVQLLQKIGILTARHRERFYGRIIIPEWNQGACTWIIGRQFPALSRSVDRHASPKYLGLSLRKPLLGSGRGMQQLQKKAPVRAILVVEGAIDYVIATQWKLPVICVALIGTHASKHQFATLLDLQQRANNAPILLALDADEAGTQANLSLYQRLQQIQSPVYILPPIEQAKDLGDLGVHPHGISLVSTAIEQALEQVSGGNTTPALKQPGS